MLLSRYLVTPESEALQKGLKLFLLLLPFASLVYNVLYLYERTDVDARPDSNSRCAVQIVKMEPSLQRYVCLVYTTVGEYWHRCDE